jgi:predicted aminopeptidase
MADIVLPRPADADRIAALEAKLAAFAAQMAAIEARLPPPRLELPRGWPCVKEAAHLAGCSQASIYRSIASGDVFAIRIGNVSVCCPDDIEKLISGVSHAARA